MSIRIDHTSPLRVKDLRSGEIYKAKMLNYSPRGIYFESDGVFRKGAKIYICIKNSPYTRSSGVLEYYYGEVRWRKDLKQSLCNYGYGIQLVSDSIKHDLDTSADSKIVKDSRKNPRKPFFRTIQFNTHKGISEGSTKNISASGAFIATEENLQIGQFIKLNLPLKTGKIAQILGQIIWLNEEGFGLKFKKID